MAQHCDCSIWRQAADHHHPAHIQLSILQLWGWQHFNRLSFGCGEHQETYTEKSTSVELLGTLLNVVSLHLPTETYVLLSVIYFCHAMLISQSI